jgi:hypothetical protein
MLLSATLHWRWQCRGAAAAWPRPARPRLPPPPSPARAPQPPPPPPPSSRGVRAFGRVRRYRWALSRVVASWSSPFIIVAVHGSRSSVAPPYGLSKHAHTQGGMHTPQGQFGSEMRNGMKWPCAVLVVLVAGNTWVQLQWAARVRGNVQRRPAPGAPAAFRFRGFPHTPLAPRRAYFSCFNENKLQRPTPIAKRAHACTTLLIKTRIRGPRFFFRFFMQLNGRACSAYKNGWWPGGNFSAHLHVPCP